MHMIRRLLGQLSDITTAFATSTSTSSPGVNPGVALPGHPSNSAVTADAGVSNLTDVGNEIVDMRKEVKESPLSVSDLACDDVDKVVRTLQDAPALNPEAIERLQFLANLLNSFLVTRPTKKNVPITLQAVKPTAQLTQQPPSSLTHPLHPPARPSPQFAHKDLTGRVWKVKDLYFAYGGFAEVYKGIYQDESGLQHLVAIKIIRGIAQNEADKALLVKRLDRETMVWHTLKHPNVLEFLGVVHNLGQLYALVSPYCAKGHVARYLEARPQSNRLHLIIGVAKGVEYLHRQGVIHGDIKGSNVLIADDGRPLLCDFGRSRIINTRGFTTWNASGTLRYTAPEVITGRVDSTEPHLLFTKETDVYAFSMVGVEILSGKPPYPMIRNEFRITFHVLEGLRPRRNEYQLSISHEKIWDILELCWVADPSERLTMSDVVQRLSNDDEVE